MTLEIPSDEQKAIDHYLRTGDGMKFSRPYHLLLKSQFELAIAAYKAGIKVVCIDQPYQLTNPLDEGRQRYMGNRIAALQGKTLSLNGAFDIPKKSGSIRVRDVLEASGKKTAAVQLESARGTMLHRQSPLGEAASQAFAAYYPRGSTGPRERSIGVLTTSLGAMEFVTPNAKAQQERLTYASSLDAVIFLSFDDAPQITPVRDLLLKWATKKNLKK